MKDASLTCTATPWAGDGRVATNEIRRRLWPGRVVEDEPLLEQAGRRHSVGAVYLAGQVTDAPPVPPHVLDAGLERHRTPAEHPDLVTLLTERAPQDPTDLSDSPGG